MHGSLVNKAGKTIGIIYTKPKTFSTGSKGWWGVAKVTDPETGRRYQVHLRLVELGSKPVAVKEKDK